MCDHCDHKPVCEIITVHKLIIAQKIQKVNAYPNYLKLLQSMLYLLMRKSDFSRTFWLRILGGVIND